MNENIARRATTTTRTKDACMMHYVLSHKYEYTRERMVMKTENPFRICWIHRRERRKWMEFAHKRERNRKKKYLLNAANLIITICWTRAAMTVHVMNIVSSSSFAIVDTSHKASSEIDVRPRHITDDQRAHSRAFNATNEGPCVRGMEQKSSSEPSRHKWC